MNPRECAAADVEWRTCVCVRVRVRACVCPPSIARRAPMQVDRLCSQFLTGLRNPPKQQQMAAQPKKPTSLKDAAAVRTPKAVKLVEWAPSDLVLLRHTHAPYAPLVYLELVRRLFWGSFDG